MGDISFGESWQFFSDGVVAYDVAAWSIVLLVMLFLGRFVTVNDSVQQ